MSSLKSSLQLEQYAVFPDFPEQIAELLKIAEPLNSETGGGLSEVYFLPSESVQAEFGQMADSQYLKILKKIVIKQSRLKSFMQQLWSKERITAVSKERMEAVFAPIGKEINPSLKKAQEDAQEAARLIPILGGSKESEFAITSAQSNFAQRIEHVVNHKTDIFLSTYYGKEWTVVDLLKEDKWIRKMIHDIKQRGDLDPNMIIDDSISSEDDLCILQNNIRRKPLTPQMEKNLKRYFNSYFNIGIQAILKRLKRDVIPPHVGWDKAKQIIESCSSEYREENFSLDETNYYSLAKDCSAHDYTLIKVNNERVISDLTDRFFELIPDTVGLHCNRSEITKLWFIILGYYHDYPMYEQEKNVSVLSVTMLRTLYRILIHVIGHLLDKDFNPPKNINIEPIIYEYIPEKDFHLIFTTFKCLFQTYVKNKGVMLNGKRSEYTRFPTVNYTFQEKADIVNEGEKIIAKLSIADLRKPQNWHYFEEFPELAKKLVVFSILVYRFYSDTGYLVDLRPPENVLGKMLLFGDFGYETDNVLITLYEDEEGNKKSKVKLVDNKDQFKTFMAPEDLDDPPGLGKTAFGLTSQIGERGILQFIAKAVGIVAELTEGEAKNQKINPLTKGCQLATETFNQTIHWLNDVLKAMWRDFKIDRKRRRKR